MRIRAWLAGCSAVLAVGVGLSLVHSGLTGSDGPLRRAAAGGSGAGTPDGSGPDAGLPVPGEPGSNRRSAAPPVPAGAVRAAGDVAGVARTPLRPAVRDSEPDRAEDREQRKAAKPKEREPRKRPGLGWGPRAEQD
jgi:hypothetical protein